MTCGPRIQISPTSPTGTSAFVSGSTIFRSTPGPATPHERSRWRFGPSRSWSSGARLTTAPVVSVRPYACQNRAPNVATLFASTSSLIGEAPYTSVSSDEKSASSTPGTISMNCSTAGTRKAWVTPSAGISCTSAAGSSSRTITLRAPSYIPATAQPPPPMWNSGMATRFTESAPRPHMSAATGSRAKKLSFDSITPLGRPVVPLE